MPTKRARNPQYRAVTPPIQSTWPTLAGLTHPAAYLLGLSGKRPKEIESGGESDEFERILNSDDSDNEEEEERNIRLRRIFGKSSSRYSKV